VPWTALVLGTPGGMHKWPLYLWSRDQKSVAWLDRMGLVASNYLRTFVFVSGEPASEDFRIWASIMAWLFLGNSWALLPHVRDFEISRFLEGAPTEEPRPDANNARSQRPATRATGDWRAHEGVSRALACVLKHLRLPTGVLHCPSHPSCEGA
jgi:hypothetical protein